MAGKTENIQPTWKILRKDVDLEEPTSLLDHVYLGEMSPWNASPWKLLVDVPKSFLEVVNVAQKLENTLQPFFGLTFHASA